MIQTQLLQKYHHVESQCEVRPNKEFCVVFNFLRKIVACVKMNYFRCYTCSAYTHTQNTTQTADKWHFQFEFSFCSLCTIQLGLFI